jgi:hypothetical protein
MKLIKNWQQAPRMYSVQALAAITALQGIAAYLTAEQLAAPIIFWPEWTYGAAVQSATAFLGITGTIARLIAQDLPPAAGQLP